MKPNEREAIQHVIQHLQALVDADAQIQELQLNIEADTESVPGFLYTSHVLTGIETLTLRMVSSRRKGAKLSAKGQGDP